MNNFHPRQRKILKILYDKKNWVKGSEIALEIGVTDRTVRNDIAYINSALKEELITSQNKRGYIISDYNRSREVLEMEIEGIPVLPEERINYILKNLLFRSRELDIFELAEKLMVSEATIENDLKGIREIISKNKRDITLSRKSTLIYLSGSEKDKRALLSELLFEETNGSFFNIFKYEKYFNNLNLELIQKKLIEAVKRYNINLNEIAIVNLVIHIAITIDRIKNDNILDIQFEMDKVAETPEYKMAEELCTSLGKEFGVSFPAGDVTYISYLIVGKRIINNKYRERNELEGIMEPSIIKLTEELISSINREFGINFQEDDNLFIGLCLHIKAMSERVKYKILLRNPILDELKVKYPFIFEIGVYVSEEYGRITGTTIGENEIGFIALHLGAAFERLNENQKGKKKIAIICPTGFTTSNLLLSKLNSVYGDRVEILGVFSFLDIDELIMKKPDLILSTVKFDYKTAIKIVEVSPFLGREDLERLDKNLNIYEDDRGQISFSKDVWRFFRRDIFFKGVSFEDEFDTIKFLGNNLCEKGYVPDNYVNYVLERERISSTSFGNLVAIPHPIVMNAFETVISVAILDKPIMWGSHKVQLVFMFSLSEEDRRKLNDLYKHIIQIIERPDGVNYLIKSEDFDNFIWRILNYEV